MMPSKRIKELIEESGLSYIDLEKKTGISKSALQRYASGITKKIPITAIEKLASALEVSAACLMGWEEQQEDIAIGIDAETGNIIPQLDDEEISSTIKDILELPDEAQGELKYFIDLLKTKYRKD